MATCQGCAVGKRWKPVNPELPLIASEIDPAATWRGQKIKIKIKKKTNKKGTPMPNTKYFSYTRVVCITVFFTDMYMI